MIFVRNSIKYSFKTKKAPCIECGVGERFYVLVYGDTTALLNNTVYKLCFPVPIHLPSFILTIIGNLNCEWEDIFTFKNHDDENEFKLFLKNNVDLVDRRKAKILKEFVVPKK